MTLNTGEAAGLGYLLTVHYNSHILEKAADDLESLCRGYPGLVQGESV